MVTMPTYRYKQCLWNQHTCFILLIRDTMEPLTLQTDLTTITTYPRNHRPFTGQQKSNPTMTLTTHYIIQAIEQLKLVQ